METKIQNTFRTIDGFYQRYLDFLCKICSFEARAFSKDILNQMVDVIADFAKKEGMQVTRYPMEKCADFLIIEINPGEPKTCLLQAHMDTVFEKGVFGEPPVKILPDRIIGPGVIDCKGGISIALLCMKSLLDNGFPNHIRLILTSDEEIGNRLGGQAEKDFFVQQSAGFPCAINCEPAENNEVVVARKGILRCELKVKGKSGHAGKQYFTCHNAILEAAHKIIALQNKSVPGGTTYSCNIISSNTTSLNIIPDLCTVSVDIRTVTMQDLEEAKRTVAEIAATQFTPGTSCEAIFPSARPPMEKRQETLDLFEKLQSLCQKYELGTLAPFESGGGSDSCYIQMAGVTSICGMGAVGARQHSPEEYLIPQSVALRAKILVSYCWDSMQ